MGKLQNPVVRARPDRLQNPVVLDILENPVVRVSLQNPVVNGLFAKPGGPQPTDSTICVYYVRLRQLAHKLLFNANAAFNFKTFVRVPVVASRLYSLVYSTRTTVCCCCMCCCSRSFDLYNVALMNV